jgi:pimeloyl-[acyl-carrier protein] methyl ester esterase
MQASETNSPLYVETFGDGQPLVVLHGWGMHGGMFRNAFGNLQKQVQLVDLPGHGYSKPFSGSHNIGLYSDYLIEELKLHLKHDLILLGWSMGGLLAQSIAAKLVQQVSKLVLVTATPVFVNQRDWRLGVNKKLLDSFAADLVSDYEKTLARFLAIQFLGLNEQKSLLRQAKALVFDRPSPNATILAQGLELLRNTDLRDHADDIRCPTLIINGENDTLITTAAAAYLAERIPNGRAVILKGAGHAPFLSHAAEFTSYLGRFINE